MLELEVDQGTRLCCLELEDAAALFRIVDENRQHLEGYLNWVSGTT